MKKSKIASIAFLALALGVGASVAFAKSDNAKAESQGKNDQTGNAVQTQEKNKVMNQGEDTQIQTQEQNTVETADGKTKNKEDNKGQINAESHRSTVANFVQSILAVADREGGIGQQVKVIAQLQNDTKDRASDLIYAVENRNKVKTFFIGTSYKNLGELRSQMVQTRNQIEQLARLTVKAENDQDKAELQAQIQTLEQEQTRINDFITQNESKFSLFGWAVKLFR